MVVPYDTGDLVRSLVRVPGSGWDRTLTPSCCDLSKVSSLAASVPVPSALPAAISRPPLQQRHGTNSGGMIPEGRTSGDPKGVASKRSWTQGGDSSHRSITFLSSSSSSSSEENNLGPPLPPPPLKRLRRGQETSTYLSPDQQTMTEAQRTLTSSAAGPPPTLMVSMQLRLVPQQQLKQLQHPREQLHRPREQQPQITIVPSVAPESNGPSWCQSQQELNALRQENRLLQQRLSLFQQLFRDKKRLTSVIQRLGIEVEK